jgi:hypothetical protein
VSSRLRTDPRLVGMLSPVVEPSMAARRTAYSSSCDDREAVPPHGCGVLTASVARYGSQPASRAARMASTRFRAFILVTMLVR